MSSIQRWSATAATCCLLAIIATATLVHAVGNTLYIPVTRHVTESASPLSWRAQQFALENGGTGVDDVTKRTTTMTVVNTQGDPVNIPLMNYGAIMFTGDITVGTPATQVFRVVFDTGSSDLWVFSSKSTQTKQGYLRYFDATKSSTYVYGGKDWAIQYGKGSCTGKLVTDTIGVAGTSVTSQVWAEVYTYTDNFLQQNQPLDGILGLAGQGLSQAGAPTVFDNLITQHQLGSMFAFYMKSSDVASVDGSLLIVGEPNATVYAPNGYHWLNSDRGSSAGLWTVALDDVVVTGRPLSICSQTSRPCRVLVDSGTSIIGVPSGNSWTALVTAINLARSDCGDLGNAGMIRCTKNEPYDLPPISFWLNGRNFTLRWIDYWLGNYACGFQKIDIGVSTYDLWIFGDTFMKTHFSVFDSANSRIGFAISSGKDTDPSRPYVYKPGGWFALATILITLGILGAGFLFMYCKHKQQGANRGAGFLAGGAGAGGGGGAAAHGGFGQGVVPSAPSANRGGSASAASAGPTTASMPRSGGYRLGAGGSGSSSASSSAATEAMSPRTAARYARAQGRPPASDGHVQLHNDVV